MPVEAAPIVVDPSGAFLGNDGAWSTFSISAGSPPQQLQVLASTQITSTWVVAPEGCDQGDASNCTESRGGTYDDSKSSSWNVKTLYGLGFEGNLGYSSNEDNGTYGYDTLAVQNQGASVSVDHQVIAAIVTKDFYVGELGLSPYPINFTNNADSSPSFLQSLKNENLIPSLSFGYTAGASYQQKNGVNGSLVLGGYDASRFVPNDVSFTFAPTQGRELVVGLQSITYSTTTTETPLLSQGVLALVDSTVPYLWLPQAACMAFEDAFGIVWDDLHNLYLVNDTLHNDLVKQNASVVFELANSLSGGPAVNITLPYASFDLEASSPLVESQSRYFPLQRASDDTQVTLGRAFLQESFLIVDYEHSNFSVSQALFNPNAESHIVSLTSNATTATTGNTISGPTATHGPIVKTTTGTGTGSHGIGTGAIAGIAIAIVLIASLCGGYFIYRTIKRRKNLPKKSPELEAGEIKERMPDDDQDSKRDFHQDLEVKKDLPATVTVNEVPMTPPSEADGNFYFACGEKGQPETFVQELPGSPGSRSEMSSPGPWSTSELSSTDPDVIRSELSTPEPMWNHPELPSPDFNHAHDVHSPRSSQPSPSFNHNSRSVRNSHSPLPSHRPLADRVDSSESEAGFTRDGMPRRPFHQRLHSHESNSPSPHSRPTSTRMDSSDSDGFFPPGPIDESSESEAIVSSSIPRRQLTHLDFCDSDASSSPRSYLPTRPKAPAPRTSSSSSSDSDTPPTRQNQNTAPTHAVGGLNNTFHSSSSSRPTIRRANQPVRSRVSRPSDSTDSDAWQTRLDSASSESPTDMSRLPSLQEGPR